MDEIYHEPKYKPGDLVIFKWPLFQETPNDPAFAYRYYIILSANSNLYRMLRLEAGSGSPMYTDNYSPSVIDEYESKAIYQVDVEKIRELCTEGPQI